MRRRSGLRLALAGIGAVAATFGTLGVVQGRRGVLNGGTVSPNVDSELRFFASWYAVLGFLLLRTVRRPEPETTIVRACVRGGVPRCGVRAGLVEEITRPAEHAVQGAHGNRVRDPSRDRAVARGCPSTVVTRHDNLSEYANGGR